MHQPSVHAATPYQRRVARLTLSDLVDRARQAAATLTAHGMHLEARGLREAADAVDPPAPASDRTDDIWAVHPQPRLLPRINGSFWSVPISNGRALSFETLAAARQWIAEHPAPEVAA